MWPEDFPEQCPPADARNDELHVYRMVKNSPPVKEDFLSTKKEYPHRPFPPKDECNSCGTSVFLKLEDILKKQKQYEKSLGSKKIAFGRITEEDGLVLETGQPTHITWWLQTDTPHLNFSEVT